MENKTCTLTEEEIKILIEEHGRLLHHNNLDHRIERITYLHRRLNAKPKGEEVKEEVKQEQPKEEQPAW